MKRWLLALLLCTLPALSQVQNTTGLLTASAATCPVLSSASCAVLALSPAAASSVISLTGTWSATVQFETSPDFGLTWAAISGTPLAGGAAVSSTTANGIWIFNVSSFTMIRARVSAFTSGTVAVNIQASSATAPSTASPGTSAGPANITQIAGTSVNTDPCLSSGIAKKTAFANITTATTTALVAVNGSTAIYVCGYDFTMSGSTVAADTLLFEQGTGVACASVPVALSATYSTGIQASVSPFGLSRSGPGTVFPVAAANGLCVVTTVATTAPAIGVTVTYVQQ